MLKSRKMTATNITFIGGHATDVVRILSDKVAIEIIQRSAHVGGMFLINTEDDCFREAIGLVQKIGEMLCNRFGPLEQSNFSFKVSRSVNLIWNASPIAINIVFARPPTRCIPLRDDTVDSIWRKKTVFDSLPQTVLVNRIPEV